MKEYDKVDPTRIKDYNWFEGGFTEVVKTRNFTNLK